MRRLILNADDFGLTRGVNRAIAEAHDRGVLTSTTLMATGAAFQDAVETAKARPRLSVGCHVVLVDGVPALPADRIPSLVPNAANGELRVNLLPFMSSVLRGTIKGDEITRETAAQIEKLQSLGVRVSHLDTHKHTHMLPGVLCPLLDAARARGVRAVRNPFAPLMELAFVHVARRPRLWKRSSQLRVLRRYASGFHREVAEHGMVSTDGCLGVAATGCLDQQVLESIADSIPQGTWELVTHPGYNDEDLAKVHTRLHASRATELEMLTAPHTRRMFEARGIELISWAQLAEELNRPAARAI